MKFRPKKRPALSPEHAAQVARFQGYPYDPAEAELHQAWAMFKRWEHKERVKTHQQEQRAPRPRKGKQSSD